MVGNFAASKAGHDRLRLYIVLEEDGEYVFLCDGRIRTVDHPKKKKKKHIQIINRKVSDTLLRKLLRRQSGEDPGERIFDEEIKYEIRQYRETQQVEL